VKKAGQHSQATISYATSPAHTREAYVDLALQLKAMGADSLCIKDMAGLLKPYDAFELVKALKARVDLPVHLHTHSTTGMSVATLVKAIEAGADRVDTAISSLSMGTSHSPTETMVEILRGTEHDTGLDIKLLHEIAACFRKTRPKYRQFESSFLGADTRILTAQVPGGMLSNLESQLREQNALGKLDAVLEEVAIVQKDFGYPPLVTPTSQIVGTQALFNVLFGRYERLTSESKDLLVGRYGRTPAESDPKLVKKALDDLKLDVPITARPADALPNELGKMEAELKAKLQTPHVSVEDVLTYAMFPQVALTFFAKRHKGPVTFEVIAETAKPAPAAAKASGTYTVDVNGKSYAVSSRPGKEDSRIVEVNGAEYHIVVTARGASENTPGHPKASSGSAPETVVAPMPGDIIKLTCEDGEEVEAGATVLVMEAMKMQLEVKTRRAGTVAYKVNAGTAVKADQALATIN
jgi:oxaloacetate decarboxylase alpha subunit